jgi:hypothetical protein
VKALNPLTAFYLSFRSTPRPRLRLLIFTRSGFDFFFDFMTYGFHWIIRLGPDGFIDFFGKPGCYWRVVYRI